MTTAEDMAKVAAGEVTGKSYGIHQIAKDAVVAIACVSMQREAIMSDVKNAAKIGGTDNSVKIGSACVDISTGAGALVLDDALQELSTLEQAAAQLVAAENKAQKQIHSVTGQG